jgi:integrase
MINIKFILWTHQINKKSETYPVRLRVTHNRKTKYFSTNLTAKLNQWSDEAQRFIESKKVCPNYNEYNVTLTKMLARANDIVKKFDEDEYNWTLEDFEVKFLGDSRETPHLVSEYIDQISKDFEERKHYGNAQVYKDLKIYLQNLYPSFNKMTFSNINLSFVVKFDHDMDAKGVTGNGRSYYHRTLRSVINKAIKEGAFKSNAYPYGRMGFTISKIEQSPEKRHLDEQQLQIFKTVPGKNQLKEEARRIFLFCYYANGMPFIDAGNLSKDNIIEISEEKVIKKTKKKSIKKIEQTREIIYRREKTKNTKAKDIKFKIINPIQEQLDWFRENSHLIDNFLLPIVSISGYSGEKLYKHIKCRYKRVLHHLKDYCEDSGLSRDISTYWSRHTFAMKMLLGQCGVAKIQQALGHQKISTTQTYLGEFDTNDLSDEIEKVL